MPNHRRLAVVAGALYLLTFVTSIPALAMKTPFLDTGANPVLATWGAVLEVLLAAACVGTAVVLFPVTRRVSEPLGLAFVASRTLEAGLILTGVLAVMTAISLPGGATASPVAWDVLSGLHTWAFLLGPAVMSAINALLLGTVLYRAHLVPRSIPAIGLVGAPLLLASSLGVMLGAWSQTSTVGAVAAVPIAVWEFALGVWLVVRGFRPEAVARLFAGAPERALPTPQLSPS